MISKSLASNETRILGGAMTHKKKRNPLKEIHAYQRSTDLLIAKFSFQRLVKEIAPDFKFESTAMMVLQEATEAHLVSIFESSNLYSIHAGRKTVTVRDLRFSSKSAQKR